MTSARPRHAPKRLSLLVDRTSEPITSVGLILPTEIDASLENFLAKGRIGLSPGVNDLGMKGLLPEAPLRRGLS